MIRRQLSNANAKFLGGIVLLFALASAPPAMAEGAPPTGLPSAPSPDQAQARELFQAGLERLDAAQYAEALERFENAYQLWKNPKILLNIATTLRALGQSAKAANAYAKYQTSAEAAPTRAEEISRILQDLDAGLGRLAFFGLRDTDRVSLNGTEVTVQATSELRVEPGEYTLRIERPSSLPVQRHFELHAAERRRIDVPPWVPQPTRNMDSAEPLPESEAALPRVPSTRAASRIPILVRADIDVARRGGVGALGLAFSAAEFVRVTGGALVGAQAGAWLGLEFLPMRGHVVPVLGISVPTFLVDGVHPGFSTEVGLRVALGPHIAPFARAALAYFPSAPRDYVPLVFVPAVGMEVSL